MILLDINVPSLPQYCTSPRGGLTVVKAWKLLENFLHSHFQGTFQQAYNTPQRASLALLSRPDSLCKPEHRLGSICLLLQWDAKMRVRGADLTKCNALTKWATVRWAGSLLPLPLHIPKREDVGLAKNHGP